MHLREGSDELQENSEINVTPFIDVMLVLLIIFMVAAPLSTVDIKVDLPTSSATPQPKPEQPIYLSIRQDRSLYVGNEATSAETLATQLDRLSQGNRQQTVFIRGDKGIDYARLIEVMDLLRKAGYLKIGLVGLEMSGG